jgi:hypothetical protein
MPKFLEDDLKAEAAKKGLRGRRADRYVYGAMNNEGYMRGNQETKKGAELQAKHDRDQHAGGRGRLGPATTSRGSTAHPHRNLGAHLRPAGKTGQPFAASQHPKKGR